MTKSFFERCKKIVKFLLSGANIVQTCRFNFRMLPFKEAIYLPIWLFGRVDISKCNGKISWATSFTINTGRWIIGKKFELAPRGETKIIMREGTQLILGERGVIGTGSIILIEKNARLYLGNGVILIKARIVTEEKVTLEDQVLMSWDGQIFDTNFHYLMDSSGVVNRKTKPVTIGKNVWIGNHVTIAKGVRIGDGCVVAQNSLVTHDFSNYSNALLVGVPAKVINSEKKYRRIFKREDEIFLNDYFSSHTNDKEYRY